MRNTSTRRLSYLVDAVDGVSAGQCDKVTVRERMIAARTADEQSFASYAVLQPYVPSLYLGCRDSELGTASHLSSHRSETSQNSRMDVFIVFVSIVQYWLITTQNVVVCTWKQCDVYRSTLLSTIGMTVQRNNQTLWVINGVMPTFTCAAISSSELGDV